MMQLCLGLKFPGFKCRVREIYIYLSLFIQRIFADCIECVRPVLSNTVATGHVFFEQLT